MQTYQQKDVLEFKCNNKKSVKVQSYQQKDVLTANLSTKRPVKACKNYKIRVKTHMHLTIKT